MKILFVEDSPQYIQTFLKQLSVLGEVITFKSAHAAINWLDDNVADIDLVVCDHNILCFEQEAMSRATGDEIYFTLRYLQSKIPFIHFSAFPCPEDYGAKDDTNFYSLEKHDYVNLLKFIKEQVLKNE